tara:strand:- start:4063 stop:4494 length:432 start_codon:yes stop_codon:yes gene_type:complete
MRTLDLNLEENDNYISGRGKSLDFNFDNAIGGSLSSGSTLFGNKTCAEQISGMRFLNNEGKETFIKNCESKGDFSASSPKISLGVNNETKSIMDRIKGMTIDKFNPNNTANTTTTTKKSKMPIALIGGGVVVVGVIMYFILKK